MKMNQFGHLVMDQQISQFGTNHWTNMDSLGSNQSIQSNGTSMPTNASHLLHQFETLARKECMKEIDVACKVLAISADPFNWNVADVQKWLLYIGSSNSLSPFNVDYFRMDGMALCELTENDFRQRAPSCGDILYAKLDIWKMAVNFCPDWSIMEQVSNNDVDDSCDDCCEWLTDSDSVTVAPNNSSHPTSQADVFGDDCYQFVPASISHDMNSPSGYFHSGNVSLSGSDGSSPYGSPASSPYGTFQSSGSSPSSCSQQSLQQSQMSPYGDQYCQQQPPHQHHQSSVNINPSSVCSISSAASSICQSPVPSPGSVNGHKIMPQTHGCLSVTHCNSFSSETNLVTSDYGSEGILSDEDDETMSNDDECDYRIRSSGGHRPGATLPPYPTMSVSPCSAVSSTTTINAANPSTVNSSFYGKHVLDNSHFVHCLPPSSTAPSGHLSAISQPPTHHNQLSNHYQLASQHRQLPSATINSPAVSPMSTTGAAVPVLSTPHHQPRTQGSSGGSHIHLWQFLKELLASPQLYGNSIRWLDRQKGVFKIEDSVRVAKLWGTRKNRPAMNYDKLSRSIRQYYKKGIMKKTERSQRLVYQFCQPYCL